jgi:metal-sulfur cluster biosynthetic enzyme
VITPDGQPPHADPYGLSWFFNYLDEDKDYLASVVRTFARDVDDIRFTLHQSSELGLAAARRAAGLLQAEGRSAAEAHRIVSAAARAAWRQDRQFADVLADDGSLGLTREQIQGAVDVIDPDLGVNIVDLGFVRGVAIEGRTAVITMTLTSAACPLTHVMESQIRTGLAALDCVEGFRVDWQWIPAWRPADITDSGREQLSAIGFSF